MFSGRARIGHGRSNLIVLLVVRLCVALVDRQWSVDVTPQNGHRRGSNRNRDCGHQFGVVFMEQCDKENQGWRGEARR